MTVGEGRDIETLRGSLCLAILCAVPNKRDSVFPFFKHINTPPKTENVKPRVMIEVRVISNLQCSSSIIAWVIATTN